MLTQSPAAGIGPGQTTPKPFSPRDVKAHIMSAGALPRFGSAQAPPESQAGDALIRRTEGEESQQKVVIKLPQTFRNYMERFQRFFQTIQKAFKQLFGPPKSRAKQLAKPHVQDLVQLTQDKRMDETLKRLSKAPGGEFLQNPEDRAEFKAKIPALMIYSINQSLNQAFNHDEMRDHMVGQLLHAIPVENAESTEDEPAEAALDDAPKPAKQTEAAKGQKAEAPSSLGESEEPSPDESNPVSGFFSLLKNNMGG